MPELRLTTLCFRGHENFGLDMCYGAAGSVLGNPVLLGCDARRKVWEEERKMMVGRYKRGKGVFRDHFFFFVLSGSRYEL